MKQLLTPWAESLNQKRILDDYPRPGMVRDSYLNLNGPWDYAITSSEDFTSSFETILVPFSPESVLSGVKKTLSPSGFLHYQKRVDLPASFLKSKLILHFDAVDQDAKIFINRKPVFTHIGGFTPFAIDITPYVENQFFEIYVIVKDVSDTSYRQTGKQRIKRGGIFYTAQSGIWQSVWLESVPQNYIKDLHIVINYDESQVDFIIDSSDGIPNEAKLQVIDSNKQTLVSSFNQNRFTISLPHFISWSPENPYLYHFEITFDKDIVKGYFGMRKFERRLDQNGIMRFYLNNKPYFLSGVLDQGYYPDGLLTPPSDEAMIYDITTMKEYGFNLLRKHIKIEPLRWYYHCDRLGMIVWQDMVSGSQRKDIMFHGALALANIHLPDYLYSLFGRKNKQGRIDFMNELYEMIKHLKNVTSISTWVPFNEAWGQFDAKKVHNIVTKVDPSRLIDHASGWSDQRVGDFYSRHIYFKKVQFQRRHSKKRILALTEFGGYSLMIKEHSFNPDHVFGYKKYDSYDSLDHAVKNLYEKEIFPALDQGLSVLIYTQLSDVEDEVNGFITYDRKEIKISKDMMKQIHHALFTRFQEKIGPHPKLN